MNQSAHCQQCKALLRSGEYDWVLVEITQGCEWRPALANVPPGVRELQQRDPEFNLAHLEDRASVMFWRWIMSCRAGNVEPLRKLAAAEFCDALQKDFSAKAAGGQAYYGECAVGALATQGILAGLRMDRAVVEVRWDGVRFLAPPGGAVQRTERGAIRRTVFVLGRQAGAHSDAHNVVGSAHCPYCGAPESSGTAATCEYCSKPLNEGALNWNLMGLYPAYAPEVAALNEELRLAGASAPAVALEATAEIPSPTAVAIPNAVELLAWLVKLAAVNGEITPEERALLQQTAKREGIDPARLATMLSAAAHNELQAPEPADSGEATRWLEALAEMALTDGKVSSEEWDLLCRVGARQGLVRADITLLVSRVKARLYQQARAALKGRKDQLLAS